MFALHQQQIFLRDIRLYLYVALSILTLLVLASLGLTCFGTSEQVNISTTLTYAGRERSLTQKLLAESLLMVYAPTPAIKKTLEADELDWTARHDAIWRGDASLHVLSVSTYPTILPTVRAVEPLYLTLHIALDNVLSTTNQAALLSDKKTIVAEAVPFYNAMEDYNTFLRNLTSQYQSMILLYGVASTLGILAVLAFSILVIFRPAFARMNGNIAAMEQANATLEQQKEETRALLEEIRRHDHETRVPVVKISAGVYAVQNTKNGHYIVKKVDGLFVCPCPIYHHNHYCTHIKYALYAEQRTDAVVSLGPV